MLQVKKIIIGFVLGLLLVVSFGATKTFADVGCCTGDAIATDPNNNRFCEATTAKCDSGIRICDDNNNTTADLDKNGSIDQTAEKYNPECWIPVIAPESVKITDFGKFFSGAVGFLLLIAFIAAFFFLILGGLSWITSGGDKAAVETARNKIINALIGLIIVAATWALFQLVGGAIGFNILRGFNIPTLF